MEHDVVMYEFLTIKQGLSQEHKNPKIDLSMIRRESLSN